MKIYKGSASNSKIVSPIVEAEQLMTDAKSIKDKDLQNAVRLFATILRKQVKLEVCKDWIEDYDLMFRVNVWNYVSNSVNMAFLSLNHHKVMLNKLVKNFVSFSKVDVSSAEYKTIKELFIHIVKTYQMEFERCELLIANAQKLKKNLDITQYTR